MKVILTGATGMVGEGILIECLQNPAVESVLAIVRKPLDVQHEKLKTLIVSDFFALNSDRRELAGYDTCFYCAGISSNGLSEEVYTKITFDTTMHFAEVVKKLNPGLVFNFISGAGTDSSEKGRMMWARVKGKTENALQRLFPGKQYSLRPGLMKPFSGQKNLRGYNKAIFVLYPILSFILPGCTLQQLCRAMITVAKSGYPKPILEVKDILRAANQNG